MSVHAVSAGSMELQAFDMVRMQCAYDGDVDYDLSGSGVPSVSLKEVMGSDDAARTLHEVEQGYPPTNGSPELRSAIAAMYERASADHILVTNGASEANFMAAWRLFEKGDEVVIIVPNYPQTWNLAESWGMEVRPLPLKEELGWQFDPEDLKAAVTRRTKAVHVCNPNNPTGAIMASEQRNALIDAVKDSGAWLLADEVYVGAELGVSRTQSLWGHHEKTLITNGLCKAYGMPGLRVGWLVGTPETLREITCYHDYLTLTHSMLSDHIARKILEPERRENTREEPRGREDELSRLCRLERGSWLGSCPQIARGWGDVLRPSSAWIEFLGHLRAPSKGEIRSSRAWRPAGNERLHADRDGAAEGIPDERLGQDRRSHADIEGE